MTTHVFTPKALDSIALGQPRFAAPPWVQDPPQCATDTGNGMATHVFTPQALDPTAQTSAAFRGATLGTGPATVCDRRGEPHGNTCLYAEGVRFHSPVSAAFRGATLGHFDNLQTNPAGVSQMINVRISPTHTARRSRGHMSGKADGIRLETTRSDDVRLD
jgi:hypothetical protein